MPGMQHPARVYDLILGLVDLFTKEVALGFYNNRTIEYGALSYYA